MAIFSARTAARVWSLALAASYCLPASPAKAAQAITIAGRDVTLAQTQTVPVRAFMRVIPNAYDTIGIDAWEVRNGKVIVAYDIDMTKRMHTIVVSDDLSDFQHVHPSLQPNGHLVIAVHLAQPEEAYHIYMDGLPNGAGRHVFRFDLPARGRNADPAARQIHRNGGTAIVGPYTVEIDPIVVPIGEISTISVRIFKNGEPARDLHPYLGVMSHGVLIGTSDLAYMHVHGMTSEMLDMSSGAGDCGDAMMMAMTPMPPDLNIGNEFELQLLAPSQQAYDLWLQFIGGKTLYTAPLLVTTR